jgi:hypothetical protein
MARRCMGGMNAFLTLALVGGERSASRPSRFTPWKRVRDTHRIGGWVGPRSGLDNLERRKSCPYRDLNGDPPTVQPIPSRYTD